MPKFPGNSWFSRLVDALCWCRPIRRASENSFVASACQTNVCTGTASMDSNRSLFEKEGGEGKRERNRGLHRYSTVWQALSALTRNEQLKMPTSGCLPSALDCFGEKSQVVKEGPRLHCGIRAASTGDLMYFFRT